MTSPPLPSPAPDEPPPPRPRGRRVLLVEDNEDAARGLARLLEVQGFDVTTVLNGQSALEALASGEPPDFVLTDLQLPDLDGLEVALHARKHSPTPYIGLITGWDLEQVEDAREKYGIDWVFAKPLNLIELIDRMYAVSGSNEPPSGPS
jgi:two-component system sensor histidine kinase/response regulator